MSQRQNIKIWWLWIYFGCKLHTLLCVLPSLFFLVIFLCLTQDKSKIYYWTTEWFLIWFPSWKNELGRPKQHTRGKEIILSPSLLCFLPPKMLFLFLCLFLHSECCVVTVSILVMGCLVVVEFAVSLFSLFLCLFHSSVELKLRKIQQKILFISACCHCLTTT